MKVRSSVKKMWSDYRSVSHLWAAVWFARLLKNTNTGGKATLSDFSSAAQDLFSGAAHTRWALAVGDNFRQFGEEYRTRTGGVLLDSNEMWCLPAGCELTVVHARMPALTDIEVTILKDYKAPAPY